MLYVVIFLTGEFLGTLYGILNRFLKGVLLNSIRLFYYSLFVYLLLIISVKYDLINSKSQKI